MGAGRPMGYFFPGTLFLLPGVQSEPVDGCNNSSTVHQQAGPSLANMRPHAKLYDEASVDGGGGSVEAPSAR